MRDAIALKPDANNPSPSSQSGVVGDGLNIFYETVPIFFYRGEKKN